jgi:hypothetical protein
LFGGILGMEFSLLFSSSFLIFFFYPAIYTD